MKRFGIEIETIGDPNRALEELQNTGLSIVDQRHTHMGSSSHAWTLKRDGSLDAPQSGWGLEIVSPPLDFDNPQERGQVDKIVAALQAAGCTPHRSAGIHVHIEAAHEDGHEMTAKEIAAVVRFTYKFEDAMYRIASAGWQTIRPGARTYALPIPEGTAQAIMHVQNTDDLWQVWENSYDWMQAHRRNRRTASIVLREQSRYTATNLMALQAHNTIEFRYFNSSLNIKRIQGYVALCMAIMDDARNGFSRSVKKSYRMGAMLNGEISEKALMMRLQQIFRSNGKDTKVCMSEDDWKNLRNSCWRQSVPQQNFSHSVHREQERARTTRERSQADAVSDMARRFQDLGDAADQAAATLRAMPDPDLERILAEEEEIDRQQRERNLAQAI